MTNFQLLTVSDSKILPDDVLASSSASSVAMRRRSQRVSAVLCWNMNCSIALRAPSGVLPAPRVSSHSTSYTSKAFVKTIVIIGREYPLLNREVSLKHHEETK